MDSYLLASHVYLCETGGVVVLLDLKDDKYLAVDATSSRALGAFVEGWPASPGPANSVCTPSADVEELLKTMSGRGLLTRSPVQGKRTASVAVEPPTAPLVEEDPWDTPRVELRHARDFLLATIRAAALLRMRRIHEVVARVRERKAQRRAKSSEFDFATARPLASAFAALRPFVFTSKDECLYNGLAMIEFFARSDLYPTWVFGVRTSPFAAHCWIQEGPVVFNDYPDRVRRYRPIMAV